MLWTSLPGTCGTCPRTAARPYFGLTGAWLPWGEPPSRGSGASSPRGSAGVTPPRSLWCTSSSHPISAITGLVSHLRAPATCHVRSGTMPRSGQRNHRRPRGLAKRARRGQNSGADRSRMLLSNPAVSDGRILLLAAAAVVAPGVYQIGEV